MPCLAVLIALLFPRVMLVILALATDYLSRAYATLLWPLLGFFFMPFTTLAYAWAKNTYGVIDGFPLVVIVIAVLADLGSTGGGGAMRRRRRRADW